VSPITRPTRFPDSRDELWTLSAPPTTKSLPLRIVGCLRRVDATPNSQDGAMACNPPRTWFGPKRYGWGISPHTWEAWLLLVVFVIVVVTLGSTVFS
jgi:hypothetical protein